MKELMKLAVLSNQDLDNNKELYILYDAILLNYFDLLEDEKKKKDDLLISDKDL